MLRINDSTSQTLFNEQEENKTSVTITSQNTVSENTTSETSSDQEQKNSVNSLDVELPNIKAEEQKLMTNMFRQSLQSKISTNPNPNKDLDKIEKDSSLNINAVTGAIVGEKIATIQDKTANEIYNYPPRSPQSDKAASVMEFAMKDAGFGKDVGLAIGAATNDDGVIILGSSGNINSITPIRYFDLLSKGKLQEKLNTTFANDQAVKKTTDVNYELKLEKITSKDLYVVEYSKPAIEVVKQSMKDAGLPETRIKQLDKFVVAGVRDGKIVIGSTNGSKQFTKQEYYEIITKGNLQQKLNPLFVNDNNVKKSTNVVFELSPDKIQNLDIKRTITYPDIKLEKGFLIKDLKNIQPDATSLKDIVLKNPVESVKKIYENTKIFPTYKKEDRVCVEERLFQAKSIEKLTSMTVLSRTELPKGIKAEQNEYIERLENPTEKVMVPCVSCKENSEIIINSNNDDATAMKLRLNNELVNNGKRASLGGSTAAATYLIEQGLKGESIDAKTLAGTTLVGSSAGVVSGKIEEVISKKILLAPTATYTPAQLFLRQGIAASAAGGIVNSGMTAIKEYPNYQAGKISQGEYVKDIVKEGAIGTISSVSGVAAGAYFGAIVGSAVPVAGNIVGAVAGGVTGYVVDKLTREAVNDIFNSQTEEVKVPMELFQRGVSLQVPVYEKDTQFDVMIRSYAMTAKSVGLPKSEVEQVVEKWSASYRLNQTQGTEVRFTVNIDGKREVISDLAFEEFKKTGSMPVAISGNTHQPILEDIKQRLEKLPSK